MREKFQHFPDVQQFIDKARIYRSEGCFSNQEIYRLKKILAKLNAQPESNSCSEKYEYLCGFVFVESNLLFSFLIYGRNLYCFSEYEWGKRRKKAFSSF